MTAEPHTRAIRGIERRAVTDGLSFGSDAHAGRAGLAGMGLPGRPMLPGARPWPVLGWRKRSPAHPTIALACRPGRFLQGTLRPYHRRASNGFICTHS